MTRTFRILGLGLLALTISRSVAAQTDRTPAQPLTLDEAISYALKNNRDVNSASHSVSSATARSSTTSSSSSTRFRRCPTAPVRFSS